MGEFRFMDLLYSRYSNPMDLMDHYMKQGQVGKLVSNIIELEYERKQEEAKKLEEQKLWSLYIHSMSEDSFSTWKKKVLKPAKPGHTRDEEMTDKDIMGVVDRFLPQK